jgi:hypothetical protein
MLRRLFVQTCLLVSGIAPLLARAMHRTAPKRVNHAKADVVLDQSGVLGADSFAIGAFTASDPAAFERAALQLRRRVHYRTTLTHASRDKWKLRYATLLIDLWLATPGARIDVLVVRSESKRMEGTPTDRNNQYINLLSRLVDASPKASGVERRLVAQTHFPAPQQAEMEKVLSARNTRVGSFLHIHERDSDLLQLVDLVVGAIHAAQPRTGFAVTNKTKKRVIAHLQQKLGIANFSVAFRQERFALAFV